MIRPLLVAAATLVAAIPAQAASRLEQLATIELPGVKGRIDHFAVDVARQRLFVAALGNGTVEVLDLSADRRQKSLAGFREPQGVGYVPGDDRLYVANAGGGVDILDGTSLSVMKRLRGLDDADNVRYDARAGTVIVGYGGGALRIMDAMRGDSRADIALSGHPESFQLETGGARVFVNVPTKRRVTVVDRVNQRILGTWAVPARANFPMALDEQGRHLFVGARSPATMLVYQIDSGAILARLPIGGDTDDLFFDVKRQLVYVVCGEGRVDIFRQDGDRYALEESVKTAPGARTGLFVPEQGRLYVAAPARRASTARVLVYRITDR